MIKQRIFWSTVTAGLLFSLIGVELLAGIEPFEMDSRIEHIAETKLDLENRMASQDPQTAVEAMVEYVKLDKDTKAWITPPNHKSHDSPKESSNSRETRNDIDMPNSQDCR